MLWRLSRKEFESQKGNTNKLAMKTIVAAGYVDSTVPNSHPFRKRVYFNDAEGNDWEFVEYLSQDPLERNDYEL